MMDFIRDNPMLRNVKMTNYRQKDKKKNKKKKKTVEPAG